MPDRGAGPMLAIIGSASDRKNCGPHSFVVLGLTAATAAIHAVHGLCATVLVMLWN